MVDEAVVQIIRNRKAIDKLKTFKGQGQLVLTITTELPPTGLPDLVGPVTIELGLSCDTDGLLDQINKCLHAVQAHWYRELREEIDRGLLFLSEDK
jgi:hypothetical protein